MCAALPAGCDSAEEPPVERIALHTNLVHLWRDAELVRTSARLPMGGARGLPHTVEARLRDFSRARGLLTRPDADPPFAWTVGRRVALDLDVLEPADRVLTLRLASAVEGDQGVAVRFNGEALGWEPIPAGPNATSVRLEVPAALQVRGGNRVELFFDAIEVRRLADVPCELPLSAVLTHALFLLPGQDGSGPPPPAGLVAAGNDPAERRLSLPARTSARVALELPGAERVALRYHVQRASVPFEVSLLTDGGRRVVLFDSAAEADGGHGAALPLPLQVEHDLSPWAGRAVLLDVQTAGDAVGRDDGQLEIGPAAVLASEDAPGADGEPGAPAAALADDDWLQAAAPLPDAAPAARAGERPSFLIVVLDALARGHASFTGHEPPTTPHLDALAARAASWTDATAPASYTLASVGTLLTGLQPETHGVTLVGDADGGYQRLADGAPRLAAELSRAGYRTFALVTNPNAASHHGYGAGFDEYRELWRDPALWDEGVAGAALPPRLAEFLAASGDAPFLAYVHVFEPHAPYHAPDDLRARFVAPYDGPVSGERAWLDAYRQGEVAVDGRGWRHLHELYDARVALADRVLGEVLAALEASGRGRDTYVVVTSDHGEALGEHGLVEHGDDVHSEQVDVPLVLAGPGIAAGPRAGPATLADVAPTVLGLAGLEAPDAMDGVDLLGAPDPRRGLTARSADWRPVLSWTRDGLRLVVDLATRRRALYDLRADPGETRDVLAERPVEAALLYRELLVAVCDGEQAREPAAPGTADVDPAVGEQLESIGYATGGGDGDPSPGGAELTPCQLLRMRLRRM